MTYTMTRVVIRPMPMVPLAEECTRSGHGWFRYLDPRPTDTWQQVNHAEPHQCRDLKDWVTNIRELRFLVLLGSDGVIWIYHVSTKH